MTLDLAKVSPQLRRMSERLLQRQHQVRWRQEQARNVFSEWAPRWEELRDLAERRERSQRLASPRGRLDRVSSEPNLPADHCVVATDGSQIEPDRHGPAEYFLINIGWALLRYGKEPSAELASEPALAYELEDLFVEDPAGQRRVPIQGGHLAARRAVDELERAVRLAAEWGGRLPMVVLQDGTLLLWVLEERPDDFLREAFLRPYVRAMGRCQELGRPLASYVSRPRSAEVAALLRAATCGGRPAECGRCLGQEERLCALDGLYDRFLFDFLQPGQRSALFATTLHQQLERYYEGQRVHFFYLNVGSEIARVEVPEWVAEQPGLLDLVHAIVVDQCRRGQGYPVALTRAHEQAVVRTRDRDMVVVLLESLFARQGLTVSSSEKAVAKRLRAV